ncbi:adenosylcobinamide amidohydrolase [Desulfolithobacter sp.]
MHLTTFHSVVLHRKDKIIYAHLRQPHLVLSTCRLAGGLRRDLTYVLNHQSCEPACHHRSLAMRDPKAYHEMICNRAGLPAERCAAMGTAANMHNAALVRHRFRDLEVLAVVTGGVETNAGRAGDPASVMETPDGFAKLKPADNLPTAGTINIMLFINHPLTEGALTRCIMTATEAKSATLQELAVNSRYSDQPATGTGTDQIIVAAPDSDGFRLTSAGKHSKLGELIGTSVKAAIKETLARQNRLTPLGQCSVKIHLERFGCSGKSLLETIASFLDQDQARLLAANFRGLDRDPVTVAAVAAMVHLRDKLSWGILPPSCRQEIMGAAAAQVACSVGGRWQKMARYRKELGELAGRTDNASFLSLCCQALALGFGDKWPADGQTETGTQT